ncbi:MAG: ABC transporter permease [Bdellovibrionales bacterium]|nr:ABC transporter permease [Bdellovibrionales bacterium]
MQTAVAVEPVRSSSSVSSRVASNLFIDFFRNIVQYREYLKQSVARDLRRRYKRSVLGYIWSMLNPLLMMTILAIVFSNIMRHSVHDYAVFLFSGMLTWTYFSSTSQGCLGTIRANARIMEQVPVPKYIFPLSVGFSGLVDLLLSFVPLLLVMIVVGHDIPVTIFAVPLVLLPLFCITMGISLICAVSNVFFEDTQHLVEVIFRAVYYLCPVLYTREHLPQWLVKWASLNPMFGLIEMMRGLIYDGQLPDAEKYFTNFGGCLVVLMIGLWIFRRADRKFIYFL